MPDVDIIDDDDDETSYRHATPAERDARRLEVLLQLPCLTLRDVAELMGLSLSMIRLLRAEGRGPRTFLLGRRVFVTREAFNEWVSQLGKGRDD